MRRLAILAVLPLMACALAGVPATAALLADSGTTAQISVTAGSVNAPTGPVLSDTGTAVRVAWTPPATGIAPQNYEIFARPSAGSYGGTPTATSTTSPWDDPTPAECSTWFYKVRSSHTNLKSAFTAESSLTVDRTAPTVNAARIVFTGGPTPVADYVRSSGGTVEVYADVSDNCAAASALTVSFDLTALGAGTIAATPGSWTPIAGGPTYNYRATFTLTSGVVANAAVKNWSVTATDPNGNTLSGAAGTSVTGDGAGPVYTGAEMVSAFTNFYDATLGNGEIPSDGSARTSGSYVYANFTDASGVASVTADLAAGGIVTGGTAVPLTSGSYTTYDGTTWPWRSAATVINTGLADGNRTFTVTATDNVGNPPVSSAFQTVEIDDTPFSATTASCTNAGNANNLLASGDRTDFILGDTLFPGSVKAGWTGATLTANPILKKGGGNPDYFDLNTDFGLTLFQGTAYDQSWNLNATNWVTANTTYTGSSFALFSPTTLRLSYQGASVTARTSMAQASFGTSGRDAAGNPVTAAFTVSCTTTPW